jgi:pSer/pThr/pTyr-binding forkhead associated (FHA) protein
MTKRMTTIEAPTAERVVRKPAFGSPHVFVLAVIDGDDCRAVHRIVRSESWIGRGPDADFVLGDEGVSKLHCRIRVDGGMCTLSDPGSTNGTRLNGRPLRPDVANRLRHLDEIELGDQRLLFLSGRFKLRPPTP